MFFGPAGSLGGVVAGDEAAQRDAPEHVHLRSTVSRTSPPTFSKLTSMPLGQAVLQLLGEAAGLVVDAGVEAELLR